MNLFLENSVHVIYCCVNICHTLVVIFLGTVIIAYKVKKTVISGIKYPSELWELLLCSGSSESVQHSFKIEFCKLKKKKLVEQRIVSYKHTKMKMLLSHGHCSLEGEVSDLVSPGHFFHRVSRPSPRTVTINL